MYKFFVVYFVLFSLTLSKTIITEPEKPRLSNLIERDKDGNLIILSYDYDGITDEFNFYIEKYDGNSLNSIGEYNFDNTPFAFSTLAVEDDYIVLWGYGLSSFEPYRFGHNLFSLKITNDSEKLNIDTTEPKSGFFTSISPPILEYKNKLVSVGRNILNELVFMEYDELGNFIKEFRLDSLSSPFSIDPIKLFEYDNEVFMFATWRDENNNYTLNLYRVDENNYELINTLQDNPTELGSRLKFIKDDDLIYIANTKSVGEDIILEMLKYDLNTDEFVTSNLLINGFNLINKGMRLINSNLFVYGLITIDGNNDPFFIKVDLELNKLDEQFIGEPDEGAELTYLDYEDGKYILVGNLEPVGFSQQQYFITEYTTNSVMESQAEFKGQLLVYNDLSLNIDCKKIESCKLIDNRGQAINLDSKIGNGNINLDFSNISSGLYILEINSCNKLDFYLLLKK